MIMIKKLILKQNAPVKRLDLWGYVITKEAGVDASKLDDKELNHIVQCFPYVMITCSKEDKVELIDKEIEEKLLKLEEPQEDKYEEINYSSLKKKELIKLVSNMDIKTKGMSKTQLIKILEEK